MFLKHLKRQIFEKKFFTRLELYREHKLNGLLIKCSSLGLL
jgi:hypothetical protein